MSKELLDDSKINKKELDQILIDYDWKFTNLIVGLSLAVIFFGFGIILDLENPTYNWLLIISLSSLFVSFIAGLLYLFFYRKGLFTEARIKVDEKGDEFNYNSKIKWLNRANYFLSICLLSLFGIDVILIMIYLFLNVVLS